MTKRPRLAPRVGTPIRPLVRTYGVLLLLALLLFVYSLSTSTSTSHRSSAFVSSEVAFTDPSESGLAIVPASCPSSPHRAGDCSVVPSPYCTFSASRTSIAAGESSTLTWTALESNIAWMGGFNSVIINQGIGPVALNGSRTVSPGATTQYTLTVYRNYGGVRTELGQCFTTITVSGALPPSAGACSVSVSPTSIARGGASMVTWSWPGITEPSSCFVLAHADSGQHIDYWLEKQLASGSKSTGPLTESMTYSLHCKLPGATQVSRCTDAATVTVNQTQCPTGQHPITPGSSQCVCDGSNMTPVNGQCPTKDTTDQCTIGVSPQTVAYQQSTNVTWNWTNVFDESRCYILANPASSADPNAGNWLAAADASGSKSSGALTETMRYRFRCPGSGNECVATAVVCPPSQIVQNGVCVNPTTPACNPAISSCPGEDEPETPVRLCDDGSVMPASGVCPSCPPGTTQSTNNAGNQVCLSPEGPKFVPFPTTTGIPATGSLQLIPGLVRPGDTTRAYWQVTNVSGCRVFGSQTPSDVLATVNDPNKGRFSGNAGVATKPITQRTTYTLICNALPNASPSVVTVTADVNILPQWVED